MTWKNIQSKGKEISHWIFIYVHDITFTLPTRDDATKTANLALTHFKKFGLKMHTGTAEKNQKQKFTTSRKEEQKPPRLTQPQSSSLTERG